MYEQRQCILIADDEERILRALKDLLGAKGFHVLTAGDGRIALELCDQYREQIDLVSAGCHDAGIGWIHCPAGDPWAEPRSACDYAHSTRGGI